MGTAKIFICHANEDKAKAEKLFHFLEEKGFQPWLDKKSLLPGQDWEFETKKSLTSSDFVLILFSNNSVNKIGFVQQEFKLALETLKEIPERKVFIIPVRIEDCNIPTDFTKFQYCDVFTSKDLWKLNKYITDIQEHGEGLNPKKKEKKRFFFFFNIKRNKRDS